MKEFLFYVALILAGILMISPLFYRPNTELAITRGFIGGVLFFYLLSMAPFIH